jgi:hypothetical protein
MDDLQFARIHHWITTVQFHIQLHSESQICFCQKERSGYPQIVAPVFLSRYYYHVIELRYHVPVSRKHRHTAHSCKAHNGSPLIFIQLLGTAKDRILTCKEFNGNKKETLENLESLLIKL